MFSNPLVPAVISYGSIGLTLDFGNYLIHSKRRITQTLIGVIAGIAISLISSQFGKKAALGASLYHVFTQLYLSQKNRNGKLQQLGVHLTALFLGASTAINQDSFYQKLFHFALTGLYGYSVVKWAPKIAE